METLSNEWYLPHRIKFWLTLILQIPAIIICLFIFTFFILHRRILYKLHHQAVFILFSITFIQLTFNLPMSIDFFRIGYVNPPTVAYCKFWIFFESTLDATNEFLVTTIAVQRHILIFHSTILDVRVTRYLVYYLPLLTCILYPFIFYMATVLIYSCDNTQWDFTSNMCGDTTCFLSNKILATFDWILNTAIPMIVIILANILLIVKVIKQKHRRQQTISWSKQRRMTLQLLTISSLYLIAWLPSVVIGLIQQLKPSDFLYQIQEDYISDMTYLICLLLPWISIGLIPEFTQWILKLFHRIRRTPNMIQPT